MIVMQLWGDANFNPLPHDGQYLKDFDFEAFDGVGEITMTRDIAQAKRFANMTEVLLFLRRQPRCRPLRPDGRPNRPLTSTNWAFIHA